MLLHVKFINHHVVSLIEFEIRLGFNDIEISYWSVSRDVFLLICHNFPFSYKFFHYRTLSISIQNIFGDSLYFG